MPREEIKVADKIIEFDMWVEGTIDNKKILVLGEVKSQITIDKVNFLLLVDTGLKQG